MKKSHAYILAAHELTELIHEWSLRWVDGHEDGDRYSCAAPLHADRILTANEGRSGSPLKLREEPLDATR